jgi:hypothetical protein
MKTYTNEELAAMNADQLKVTIMELQGQQAAPAQEQTAIPDTAAQDTTQTAEPETPVQTDIEGMKAAIAQFEASGAKAFPDALAMMKQKLSDVEAEAKAAVKEVEGEAEVLEEEEATWAENFRQEHGVSVPVALVVGGYIVWQVGAAVARVLGVA